MKKYKYVDVTESKLEDFIRVGTDVIEEGLKYVDHQRYTDRGRLDVLLVDSGKSAVVAELKIVEDDAMLLQGLDYYDYVSTNIEAFARLYKDSGIDPTQPIRLMLIAPSFSISLINRSKWIDANISLFTYRCIKLDGTEDITPVFSEVTVPAPTIIEEKYNIEDRLAYITNVDIRNILKNFLKELPNWKKDKILIEPIKYAISVKVGGRVFMYLEPRRDKFLVSTYNTDGKWTGFPVNTKEELDSLVDLIKSNMEKKSK